MVDKKSIDLKSIKEHERAKRALIVTENEIKSVDFDQWWADRSAALKQPPHLKEILKVDAAARGVTGKQAFEKWDWAARQFGLNI